MQVGRRGGVKCNISHILYADDTLIICEANREQFFYLRGILLIFEAVTGLRVNLSKSSLFSINADNCIEDLAEVLGCKVEQLPTTYLGLPSGC